MCSGEVRPLADCGQRGLRFETQHQLAPGRRGRGMRSRGMPEHHRRRISRASARATACLAVTPRCRSYRLPARALSGAPARRSWSWPFLPIPLECGQGGNHQNGGTSPAGFSLLRAPRLFPAAAASPRRTPAGQAVQRPPSPVYTSDIREDSLKYSNSLGSGALYAYRRSIGVGDVMFVGRVEGSGVGGSERCFRGVERAGHDRNLTRTSVRIKGSGPEVTLLSHLPQCFGPHRGKLGAECAS